MAKSPDAFRTISEVAEWLGIQAHVLRFWESKFSQVKPVKRAGGRRYYRPVDMLLLGGIKKLLHDDGLTIKGVQKILREQGMSHVSDMSAPLDETTLSQLDDVEEAPMIEVITPEEETGVVLSFEAPAPETPEPATRPNGGLPSFLSADAEASAGIADEVTPDAAAALSADEASFAPENTPAPISPPPAVETAPVEAADVQETPEPAVEDTLQQDTAQEIQPDPVVPEPAQPTELEAEAPETSAPLPSFLRRPLDDTPPPVKDNPPPALEPVADVEAEPRETASEVPAPKPRVIDIAPFPQEADITAKPSVLAAAYAIKSMDAAQGANIAPLLGRLQTLRDSMAARRRNAPDT
jgi:DNA-binding transcriptional MerR regulator